MKILVPVDGSQFSEQALPTAIAIAQRSSSDLQLARVHQAMMSEVAVEVTASLYETVDRETRDAEVAYLLGLSQRWQRRGVAVHMFSLDAPVAEGLAAHIEAESIDLVVMTTHGRGGLSRVWLGSVADRLVRTTNVPVLLLRPRAAVRDAQSESILGPSHVLIPLDGSKLAESIIEPAIALGTLTGARYTLLQVVAPPIRASAECSEQSTCDSLSVRHDGLQYLERRAATLRERGLSVETSVVVQSNTAAAIAEAAIHGECDLIAMATHGRTGWQRLALGSVADKVLRSSPTPLLVQRPASSPDDADVYEPLERFVNLR